MSEKTTFRTNLSPSCIKSVCARLLNTNESNRAIAKQVKISATTVDRLCRKIKRLNIKSYAEIATLSPSELIEKFYSAPTPPKVTKLTENKLLPDFNELATKMIEFKSDSIKAMYNEYLDEAKKVGKEALSLTYFSARVKQEKDSIEAKEPEFYFSQNYPYGLYAELDFTGDQYELFTYNGRVRCWIMVVCFPASYYLQAQFVTAQSTAESCRVLGEVFRKIGNRYPCIIKVDNAKCWSTKHQYGKEAIINRNFENYLQEMGICAEAAPPYSPQRKSCAEHSVNRVQQLMKTIKTTFSKNQRTIAEHNKLLMQKIDELINQGTFRRSQKITRDYLFKTHEYPALTVARKIPYYVGDAISVVVPNSYMVTVNNHEYSVPYLYIGKRVEIYTVNDYVLVKYEGKEIACHLRIDGIGQSVKNEHRPQVHQEIVRKNSLYKSTDDVLRVSSGLDEGLYLFCKNRISRDKNKGEQETITISACRSVINAYKKSISKPLFSEACVSILQQDPSKWNYYELKKVFAEVLKEYSNKKSIEHQLEIFRTSEKDDEAYLRSLEQD